MVVLGLVLILAGVLATLAAIFVSEGGGELLGIDVTLLAVFLVGVAAGAAVLCGAAVLKWGTRRSLAQRRERKELSRLSRKVDRIEAERRPDDHPRADGGPDTRPEGRSGGPADTREDTRPQP